MKVPSGSRLVRSASASASSLGSPSLALGSPSRYNPARLLRRKASRSARNEREDTWSSVKPPPPNPGQASASSSPTVTLPSGTASAPIPASGSNSTVTTPSLTVSPPGRPWGQPPPVPGFNDRAPEVRRQQGHTRAHSGGGIPPNPQSLSNFGSVRSMRSIRSIQSEGETAPVVSGESSMGTSPKSSAPLALAAAFAPPVDSNGAPAHPFLAGAAPVEPPPPRVETPVSASNTTALSPPRRTGRPAVLPTPPLRLASHTSAGSAGSQGTQTSQSSQSLLPTPLSPGLAPASPARNRSRPTSPASNESGGSDGHAHSLGMETAAWLARKPSGRRRVPLASAFSSAPTAKSVGSGHEEHAQQSPQVPRPQSHHTETASDQTAPNDRRIRRVASHSSAHVPRWSGTGDTFGSSLQHSTRRSHGPSSFVHSGERSLAQIVTGPLSAIPPTSGHGYSSSGASTTNSHSSASGPLSSTSASSTNSAGSRFYTPLVTPVRESSSSPFEQPPATPSTGERPRTPDSRESYNVSVHCAEGDEEVRWEIVVRRTREPGHMPPPGPITLGGPGRNNVQSPPMASSINLSLALDVDNPSGKLVFISLPDANSTPTRLRSRPSASPRQAAFAWTPTVSNSSSGPRPAPLSAVALSAACGSTASLSSTNTSAGSAESPPSAANPLPSAAMPFVTEQHQPPLPGTPATPATPCTPTTPATPHVHDLSVPANPLSPRALKRHAMHAGMFPVNTVMSMPPPPLPRRDHRRATEHGSSTPSPIRSDTYTSSAGNTPGPSPTAVFVPSVLPSMPSMVTSPTSATAHQPPSRPHLPASAEQVRRATSHPDFKTNGSIAGDQGSSGYARPPIPLACVNGGKTIADPASNDRKAHIGGRYVPGLTSPNQEDERDVDGMEHIVTPISPSMADSVELGMAHW